MSGSFLGHDFRQPGLLAAALRHSSLAGRRDERPTGEHFERLEFLGDRVIGLIVAQMLMEAFPSADEGLLTRHHTALVRAGGMARIAREAGADAALQTAAGEGSSASLNDNILADALEAALGAIYLDGGLTAAEPVIRRLWQPHLSDKPEDMRDAKTRLQEWAQARGPDLPLYEVLSQSGPPHAPVFQVKVTVTSGHSAEGTGGNKRAAEQQAAANLLEKVNG